MITNCQKAVVIYNFVRGNFPVRFLAICKFYGSENSYSKSAKHTLE